MHISGVDNLLLPLLAYPPDRRRLWIEIILRRVDFLLRSPCETILSWSFAEMNIRQQVKLPDETEISNRNHVNFVKRKYMKRMGAEAEVF
jgi:hypothetical protein